MPPMATVALRARRSAMNAAPTSLASGECSCAISCATHRLDLLPRELEHTRGDDDRAPVARPAGDRVRRRFVDDEHLRGRHAEPDGEGVDDVAHLAELVTFPSRTDRPLSSHAAAPRSAPSTVKKRVSTNAPAAKMPAPATP